MRRSIPTLAVVAVLLTLPLGGGAATAAPFANLDPGAIADLHEEVPVNFVFVGYEPGQVSQSTFLAQLPSQYRSIVRSRLWYGVTEFLGLNYTYDFDVTYTDAAFENSLFAALTGLAKPQSTVDGLPRTLYQEEYNNQQNNILDVGTNYFIDAPTVEKWLIDHAPAGVDTREDTVFFINWWERPDFKFHTYTKFNEPDPDTGYDFGRNRQSRKIIAWGGTTAADEETGLGSRGTHRVWFHDLSAGPDSWNGGWNVDDADIDGDGVLDYRLPPIWEYAQDGFRRASMLSRDLGRLARYSAIDTLFTTSPLYPPALTPPRLPGSINMDLNTYEGWRGVNASQRYQTPALLLSEESELHRVDYTVDQQDVPFLGTKSQQCYSKWLRDEVCYPAYPYPPFANLFLDNALNLDRVRDGGGEYEGLHFNYATETKQSAPFLGFADDNYLDGTQSGVFNFVSPLIVSLGYGLTTTQIHEFGHHISMSHPHDGWDYETRRDFEPTGSLFFAWAGDLTNSMMSYIDLNWDFSQFDHDNFNRFGAAAYITNANAIAEDILADPDSARAADELASADARIGQAKAAMAAHDYLRTFDHAKRAYELVLEGAAEAGVPVEASDNGWTVLPKEPLNERTSRPYAYVDRYIGQRALP
jgi:hypothetical protein